jgi:hypothetical protein
VQWLEKAHNYEFNAAFAATVLKLLIVVLKTLNYHVNNG